MIVYFNGNYLEKSNVAISPDDRGFLFADGLYEVVRVYHGSLFEAREHLLRLTYGLQELRISGCNPEELETIAHRLLADNQLGVTEATIYIQITRGQGPRSHRFPPADTRPTIYVEAKPFTPPLREQEQGAAAIVVSDQRWNRCDLKTISLLPNILAHQTARDAGAFEAIFSRNGALQEGTHSSMLFVKNDRVLAPPLTNFVLPSVTRQIVLSLAAQAGITTEVRACFESELGEFQEAMMLGTGSEIVPIITVNGQKVGSGQPGVITRKLQDRFRRTVCRLST